jgi:hypothetical protein
MEATKPNSAATLAALAGSRGRGTQPRPPNQPDDAVKIMQSSCENLADLHAGLQKSPGFLATAAARIEERLLFVNKKKQKNFINAGPWA